MLARVRRLAPSMVLFAVISVLLLAPSAVGAPLALRGAAPGVSPADGTVSSTTAAPPVFSYQGQLTDPSGAAITNPGLSMTFRLFATASGGVACWSETHDGANAVAVDAGLFSVLLGQLAPIDPACITGTPYLELVIGVETLSPREPLTSVAFAVEASTLPHDAATRGSLRVTGDLFAGLPGEEFILHTRSNANGDFMQITSRDAYGDWKWPQAITYRDANGYVGLAVNPPADRLHVGGDVRLASRIRFTQADADGGNFAVIGLDAGAPRNFEIFDYYQWGPLFRIWQNRDVEMYGNASIGGALAVNGNVSASGVTLPTNPSSGVGWADTSAALGRAQNDGNFSVDARAGDLVLRPAGGKRLILTRGEESIDHPAALVIEPNGFVGIGTNAPGGKLQIVDASTDAHGATLTLGPIEGSNLRLGYHEGFSWIQSHGGRPLAINSLGNNVGIGTTAPTQTLDVNGGLRVRGGVSCGALVEENLQTPQELAVGEISRFEEGDVLCWGIDQLELCSVADDRLVQAVADINGRPIIIGAEKVKVLGPVQRGDILVTSEVPGYAMVNNDPRSGSVIAQALEDFDGERGHIKAMIRKW